MRALLLLLALLLGAVQAQPAAVPPAQPDGTTDLASDERGWPVGDDAARVADAAVAAWLERPPVVLTDLAALAPAEACLRLPALISTPPPPPGTRVNLDDRRLLEEAGDAARLSYTYAAVRANDALDVVQVDLVRNEAQWSVERVGFRVTHELGGVRAWLQTATASWLFVALTIAVLVGLARPSPLRRALGTGLETARRHRTTVAVTMGLLYLVFAIGVGAGAALPDECDVVVLTLIEGAVDQLGALQAYASGDVARAAVVTFYQNFVVVTFSVHFFLVLLLGLPSYLLAVPQFFVLGIPFGLLAGASAASLVPVMVLVLLELTAYFLVVAGGGIVLGTVFRRGFGAYLGAVRAAASLLVPAGLLLLLGAWYEALLLIVIGL